MASMSVGGMQTKSKLARRTSSVNYDDIQGDVRHDEDQQVKFQEIVELFLAAGYFRARIKGLSDFDKIVGGMTWCIEVCNVDIDVDLLFQENLNIGQKIALTEKLVKALRQIKCPHRLEPHQIQGLDCIHIFPVSQWLVKRALEVKAEVGDFQRAFAVYQFTRSHGSLPEELNKTNDLTRATSTLKELKESYGVRRKFRRTTAQELPDEETRVQATLMEYGRHGYLLKRQPQAAGKEAEQQAAQEEALQSEKLSHLMRGMAATTESKLSASSVGNIVHLQSAQIQEVASHFEGKRGELEEDRLSGGGGGAFYQQRLLRSLQKQIAEQQEQMAAKEDVLREAQQTSQDCQAQLQQLLETQRRLQADLEHMEQLEAGANQDVVKQLRELVALNERLKANEAEFKAHCKAERARLQGEIEALKSADNAAQDQDYVKQLEAQFATTKEKLQRVRLLLAHKNREIAALQRRVDDVPLRAELSQYQRRFAELCTQVSAKHKETKQYYTLYNTLNDSKMYLSKEVSLLNSIAESFTESMATPSGRKQFLAQFEQIVEQIRQTKVKVEKKREEEKAHRDQLLSQHIALVEQQRLYVKMVKDFKEECRKNEILMAKIKERSH